MRVFHAAKTESHAATPPWGICALIAARAVRSTCRESSGRRSKGGCFEKHIPVDSYGDIDLYGDFYADLRG
jgi:hypothetical protein